MSVADTNQPLGFLGPANSPEEMARIVFVHSRRSDSKYSYDTPMVFKGKLYVWYKLSSVDVAQRVQDEIE